MCVTVENVCQCRERVSVENVSVFVFEVVVKIASRGVCIGTFTFLRDPWNWLDVAVVITTCEDDSRSSRPISEETGSCHGVLTVRPQYLGPDWSAALHGNPETKMCHLADEQPDLPLPPVHQQSWYDNDDDDDDDFILQKTLKHKNFSCLSTDTNPNYGFTNYDSFGFSLLSVVRLMGKDFWENLFQLMMRAASKTSVIAFVLVVFSGSFLLVSLLLVVVAMGLVEQVEATVAEDRRREEEFVQILEVMKRREEVMKMKEEEKEPAVYSVEDSEKHDPPQLKKLTVTWNCCGCWTRLKLRLCTFVTNPFFDLIIVVCIVFNCLFLAMEHFPMTMEFEQLLNVTSLFFTGIFTAEMLLRLMAMDPYHYFRVGWNVFDSIIVAVSLVELALADVVGFPALRCFKLMRGLRLARWWPTLHMLMKIIWTSVSALRNLTLVLLIMVFLFTVVGTKLFQDDYRDHVCSIMMTCELPRWHMHNFFNTFILIFRLLCGEWIETLWDCMEVSGQTTCLIFFIVVFVTINLLVLHLFLALFLSSIRGDYLVAPIEKGGNNLKIAIDQIKAGVAWILEHFWTLLGKKNPVNSHHKVVNGKENSKEYLGLTLVTSDQPLSESKVRGNNYGNKTSECHNSASCRVPVAEAEVDLKMSESEEEKHKRSDWVDPTPTVRRTCDVEELENLWDVEELENLWDVEELGNLWDVEEQENLWDVEEE
ncbi:hypothetical protein F2P81_006614 [Scophthalmus maximus]|uniref:Ion transport domain-containing protein n=1 Tax=Scophthalmus maximus TaxID=52904 RepID=A0A6A4SZS5_SCOMX|nr:hypothetical protein F2P81_006614 [Scophthalmus maximus]